MQQQQSGAAVAVSPHGLVEEFSSAPQPPRATSHSNNAGGGSGGGGKSPRPTAAATIEKVRRPAEVASFLRGFPVSDRAKVVNCLLLVGLHSFEVTWGGRIRGGVGGKTAKSSGNNNNNNNNNNCGDDMALLERAALCAKLQHQRANYSSKQSPPPYIPIPSANGNGERRGRSPTNGSSSKRQNDGRLFQLVVPASEFCQHHKKKSNLHEDNQKEQPHQQQRKKQYNRKKGQPLAAPQPAIHVTRESRGGVAMVVGTNHTRKEKNSNNHHNNGNGVEQRGRYFRTGSAPARLPAESHNCHQHQQQHHLAFYDGTDCSSGIRAFLQEQRKKMRERHQQQQQQRTDEFGDSTPGGGDEGGGGGIDIRDPAAAYHFSSSRGYQNRARLMNLLRSRNDDENDDDEYDDNKLIFESTPELDAKEDLVKAAFIEGLKRQQQQQQQQGSAEQLPLEKPSNEREGEEEEEEEEGHFLMFPSDDTLQQDEQEQQDQNRKVRRISEEDLSMTTQKSSAEGGNKSGTASATGRASLSTMTQSSTAAPHNSSANNYSQTEKQQQQQQDDAATTPQQLLFSSPPSTSAATLSTIDKKWAIDFLLEKMSVMTSSSTPPDSNLLAPNSASTANSPLPPSPTAFQLLFSPQFLRALKDVVEETRGARVNKIRIAVMVGPQFAAYVNRSGFDGLYNSLLLAYHIEKMPLL